MTKMNNLKRICLILVTIFCPLSIAETFANNSTEKASCSALLKTKIKGEFLLGSYTLEKGEGEFETFALEDNNNFSSWLHERPEFLDLHWQFKASSCEVVISGEPLPSAIRFRVVDKTSQSLTVEFLSSDTLEENEGFAIYQAL